MTTSPPSIDPRSASGAGFIRNEMDQPAALASLPDDLLERILRHLAPRDLAVALGVCRAGRALVDGRRLLRADLLPRSVGGIFLNFNCHNFSEYFFDQSSTSGAAISSMTDYLPITRRTSFPRYPDWIHYSNRTVEGNCNGLVLVSGGYVFNPATRWWAQIPSSSHAETKVFYYRNYLAFDPTLSPHHEVFSFPHLFEDVRGPGLVEESEWPPLSCVLHVFSSRTSVWEERLFVRDGEAATTISDMRRYWSPEIAVYYKRALYVHCQANVVLRISSSDSKYRAIQPPITDDKETFHLGKSKDGVYFASYSYSSHSRYRIWVLNESCGQTEWLVKYHVDLTCALPENPGSWVLQDVNYNFHRDCFSDDNKKKEYRAIGSLSIMGFHPFEEILFLRQTLYRGLAYHLDSSKLQDLGYLYPTEYDEFAPVGQDLLEAYIYTPCWM